jgi:hypothetical protein
LCPLTGITAGIGAHAGTGSAAAAAEAKAAGAPPPEADLPAELTKPSERALNKEGRLYYPRLTSAAALGYGHRHR